MSTDHATGEAHPRGLVSISEAAKLLTASGDRIERSSLSRYCDEHGLKRGKQGRSVVVNFEEVRAHRAANYTREVMSGQAVAPVEEVKPVRVASPVSPSDTRPRGVVTSSAVSDGGNVSSMDPARRKKEAEAEKAELDLAERKGQIMPVEDGEAAIADALAEMRQAFAGAAKAAADEALSDLGLPAEKRRILQGHFKRYGRKAEESFIFRASEYFGEMRSEQSAARIRIEKLADQAAKLRAADIELAKAAGLI